MEVDEFTLGDEIPVKFKRFFDSFLNSNWAPTASEKTIDDLFKFALELEDVTSDKKQKEVIQKSYPSLNLNRVLNIVLENIIKNQFLNEHLTLYAINKYCLVYSKEDLIKFLDNFLSEVELRSNLYELIEGCPDIELDFFKLNKFLSDLSNCSDLKPKIENALRNQTLTFLKAIKHAEALIADNLMSGTIDCLEAQTDLRLWFMILKEKNLETVVDLCVVFDMFFKAVLKFFDRFAEEIESNYDEELSVQYSHVNLDFEDFVNILQVFLGHDYLKKATSEYLDGKNLCDKNFCFWIDIKACI